MRNERSMSETGIRYPTARLLLREFVEADWPAVFAYQSDSRYLRYYLWTERKEADVRHFVDRLLAWQRESPRLKYQLAITLPETGRLIGNCGIRMAQADAVEAELGYELAPDQWGRGYATEAAQAMIEYGFERLGVHRIWASCIAKNRASARVLEKVGMRLEGRLREKQWMKGRWWDTLLYGLLEDEWNSEAAG